MRKFLLTFVAIIASCMAMAASIAENEVDYSYLQGKEIQIKTII